MHNVTSTSHTTMSSFSQVFNYIDPLRASFVYYSAFTRQLTIPTNKLRSSMAKPLYVHLLYDMLKFFEGKSGLQMLDIPVGCKR